MKRQDCILTVLEITEGYTPTEEGNYTVRMVAYPEEARRHLLHRLENLP